MPTPKKSPDVNPLVDALNPDPSQPPRRTYKLWGLPGASPSTDHTRLWLDAELTSFVDVPNDAIAYSKTLDDDAGTILWVDADAPVTFGSVSQQASLSKFLTGQIASAHLAGSATGAPVTSEAAAAALPSNLPCQPIQTGPICPTLQLGCRESLGACPSIHVPCPPPHTEAGCPSVQITCPHTIVGCPPHTLVGCPPPPTIVGCPPHTTVGCPPPPTAVACPSVQILCPSDGIRCPSFPAALCPSQHVPCASVHAPPFCAVPTHANCPSVTSLCPSQQQALCPSIQLPCRPQ